MIGALGGISLLVAAQSIEVRTAGIAGRIFDGPIPLQIEVDGGEGEASAGQCVIEYTNADGDTVQDSTQVSIVPGTTTRAWVSITPPQADAFVSALLLDTDGTLLDVHGPTALPQLATRDRSASDIYIAGSDRLGLEALAALADQQVTSEPLRAALVRVDELPPLPESWIGLDTLIWHDAGPPDDHLGDAIMTWVRRGGHLVLTPPAMAQPWGAGSGPLSEAAGLDTVSSLGTMPTVEIQRLFDTPIEGTGPTIVDLPTTSPWQTVLTARHGAPLVARRSLGHGHVTAVAIDPSRRALDTLSTADNFPVSVGMRAFWGPVLGRRDLVVPTDVTLVKAEDRLRKMNAHRGRPVTNAAMLPWLDRQLSVSSRILVVLLCTAIWAVVVPVVLWMRLRRSARTRWLWPTFAGLSVAASACAWGIGESLMHAETQINYIAVVDQVAGDPTSRMHAVLDVQIPGTGEVHVSAMDSTTTHAQLGPWQLDQGVPITFGDVRRLSPTPDSGTLNLIARDANSRMQLDWIGQPTPESWGRLLAVSTTDPVRVEDGRLKGTIDNRSGHELHAVSLIWIRNDPPRLSDGGTWTKPANAGFPQCSGQWWKQTSVPADATINLAQAVASPESDVFNAMHVNQMRFGEGIPGYNRTISRVALEYLSLWSLATPPPWAVPEPMGQETQNMTAARRKAPEWRQAARHWGRHLDLGPWVTSDVLIVLAWIEADQPPFPIMIDDAPPNAATGEVFLRWIVPLSDDMVEETP